MTRKAPWNMRLRQLANWRVRTSALYAPFAPVVVVPPLGGTTTGATHSPWAAGREHRLPRATLWSRTAVTGRTGRSAACQAPCAIWRTHAGLDGPATHAAGACGTTPVCQRPLPEGRRSDNIPKVLPSVFEACGSRARSGSG